MKPDLLKLGMEAMAAARKETGWDVKTNNTTGTLSRSVLAGAIDDKGQKRHHAHHCHAYINQYTGAVCLWSCFAWRTSETIALKYFNWLVHKSPWAQAGIIPTGLTDEFMFKEGFVWTDLDKIPGNLLHNFLVASRMAAEWPELIKAWSLLVSKYKIDPSFAFLFLTCWAQLSITGSFLEKDKAYPLTHKDKYDWPLDMYAADNNYVLNFLGAKTEGLSETMFSPTAATKPVKSLWGKALSPNASSSRYVNILKKLYAKEFGEKLPGESSLFCGTVYETGFSSKAIIEIALREEERLFSSLAQKKEAA
jgi:hypothetical protein